MTINILIMIWFVAVVKFSFFRLAFSTLYQMLHTYSRALESGLQSGLLDKVSPPLCILALVK